MTRKFTPPSQPIRIKPNLFAAKLPLCFLPPPPPHLPQAVCLFHSEFSLSRFPCDIYISCTVVMSLLLHYNNQSKCTLIGTHSLYGYLSFTGLMKDSSGGLICLRLISFEKVSLSKQSDELSLSYMSER